MYQSTEMNVNIIENGKIKNIDKDTFNLKTDFLCKIDRLKNRKNGYKLVINGNFLSFKTELNQYKIKIIYNKKIEDYEFIIKNCTEDVDKLKELIKDVNFNEFNSRIFMTNEKAFITKEILSDDFCGIPLAIEHQTKTINYEIAEELGIIFMETELYHNIRLIADGRNKNNKLLISDNTVPINEKDVNRYKKAFIDTSYINYYNVFYTMPIINCLYKSIPTNSYTANLFYRILKVYIPVIVKSSYMFNPLLDNIDLNIKNSKLLNHKSIESCIITDSEPIYPRKSVYAMGKLEGYLLTHKEICESLGLKYFIRFSPQLLYKLIVGYLRPDLKDFPSIGKNIMYNINRKINYNFKRYYSIDDYRNLIVSIEGKYGYNIETYPEKYRYFMNNYTEVPSILYHLQIYKASTNNSKLNTLDNNHKSILDDYAKILQDFIIETEVY